MESKIKYRRQNKLNLETGDMEIIDTRSDEEVDRILKIYSSCSIGGYKIIGFDGGCTNEGISMQIPIILVDEKANQEADTSDNRFNLEELLKPILYYSFIPTYPISHRDATSREYSPADGKIKTTREIRKCQYSILLQGRKSQVPINANGLTILTPIDDIDDYVIYAGSINKIKECANQIFNYTKMEIYNLLLHNDVIRMDSPSGEEMHKLLGTMEFMVRSQDESKIYVNLLSRYLKDNQTFIKLNAEKRGETFDMEKHIEVCTRVHLHDMGNLPID